MNLGTVYGFAVGLLVVVNLVVLFRLRSFSLRFPTLREWDGPMPKAWPKVSAIVREERFLYKRRRFCPRGSTTPGYLDFREGLRGPCIDVKDDQSLRQDGTDPAYLLSELGS